jgi:hypothetical protein
MRLKTKRTLTTERHTCQPTGDDDAELGELPGQLRIGADVIQMPVEGSRARANPMLTKAIVKSSGP